MKIGAKASVALILLVVAVSLTATVALADKDDDQEISTRTVTMSELPQLVKSTVSAETTGLTITSLQEITTHDGLIYEVEWTDGEYQMGLLISPKGKILDRERDKADNEDDGDGEEDDD